ncbi:hypothetical protein LTR35_001849 [Friedmanniomyces endolithicus]|uniref:Uncharacterized protein n=1 Tax=Friedmanniomyces endolithicus TaxID=329885 RepID=A0AAN6JD89_9PEZI|nr:hypothetical protein LTR35_001849 [Friedmanniomyces endolithicus]KAK0296935.1 hypothetical protein LTS00_004735 [Friedmanniomyces endolithicus]KAK0325344.1 hypothetical protein LTR82_003627 [Friedmanniomyces endolithicus]
MKKARKFSFDIPHLKLGPSKSDTRALRNHLAGPAGSPPPTPKSVRPPLSPLAEAELRAACAYVLSNFKPSHIHYSEQHGASGQKQQLDYAAIKESVQSGPSAPPLSRARTQDQVATIKDEEEHEDAEPARSEKFRYKPAVAIEDLFTDEVDQGTTRRKSAILRAELLMSAQSPNAVVVVTRDRSDSHLRSASSPVPTTLVLPKMDLPVRPFTAPRTDSVETTGSTPQTDATDYPESEKASTAMTSAAVTPARSSKRTSAQALQSAVESGSVPKTQPASGDWMRQELERHKKVQEERRQQEAVDDETKAEHTADTTPTQSSTHTATPVAVRMPRRKPVPASRSASRQESRSDSAQEARESREQARSPGKTVAVVQPPAATADTETTPALTHPPAPSRQAPALPPSRAPSRAPSSAPSRARSMSRRVKDYVRSASAHRPTRNEDGSRPPSRGANVVRQVKDYIRPSMDAGSRQHSVDIGRGGSRSVSIDSYHTSASEIPPSVDASTKQGRMWKPFHRRDRSQTDPYVSRPGTSGSTTEGRGRMATRDAPDYPSAKPSINLNRDLPPLPGLDQWKSEEAEPSVESEQDASTVSSSTPTLNKSQRSRQDRPKRSTEPEIGERDEILAARMGLPIQKPMISPPVYRPTGSPALPTTATPAPPSAMLSANFSSRDDFDYAHLSPSASNTEPPPADFEMKKTRRRSKTAQATLPTEHHADLAASADRPAITGKAQLMNYSRIAAGALSRKTSRAGVAGTPHYTPRRGPASHSSRPSENLARNFSADDAGRVESPAAVAAADEDENVYQNVVAISTSPSSSAAAPATQSFSGGVGEKAKGVGKWWKGRGGGKNGGKQGNWMDQVVKSGSRSGVMVAADEVADAPVVRY